MDPPVNSNGAETLRMWVSNLVASPDDVGPRMVAFFEGFTLYEILGVPKDADDVAVKTAYRKLSLIVHPDKVDSPHDEAKRAAQTVFAKLAMAKEILCDSVKRKQYDERGHVGGTVEAAVKPKAFEFTVNRTGGGDVHLVMKDPGGAMIALVKVVRFREEDEGGSWVFTSQTKVCELDYVLQVVKMGPCDLCAITVLGVNSSGVGPQTTIYRFGVKMTAATLNNLLAIAVRSIKVPEILEDLLHFIAPPFSADIDPKLVYKVYFLYLKLAGKGGKNPAKKEKTVAAFVKQRVGKDCRGPDIIGINDGVVTAGRREEGNNFNDKSDEDDDDDENGPLQGKNMEEQPVRITRSYVALHGMQGIIYLLLAIFLPSSLWWTGFGFLGLVGSSAALALIPGPHDTCFGLGEHAGYLLMLARCISWPLVVVPHLLRLYVQAPSKAIPLRVLYVHRIALETVWPIVGAALVAQDGRIIAVVLAAMLAARSLGFPYLREWNTFLPFGMALAQTCLFPLYWFWFVAEVPIMFLFPHRIGLLHLVIVSLFAHYFGLIGGILAYILAYIPPVAVVFSTIRTIRTASSSETKRAKR